MDFLRKRTSMRLDVRRTISVLLVAIAFLMPSVVFAGGKAEVEPARVAEEASGEAPALAARVTAGELPPVEDRLPTNPLVIEPHQEIGRYGGDMRSALVGSGDAAWFRRTIFYDGLMRWAPDWSSPIPNVAEDVAVSDDAREYTFSLREGMRWSDGEPFTADDIIFYVHDFAYNSDLSPAVPGLLTDPDGNRATVEALDALTVRFTFESPNAMFLQQLAGPNGMWPVTYARHYLEQYHADFNPDVDAVATDAGFDSWVEYFEYQSSFTTNPELPQLTAWIITQPYTGDTQRVVFERNPYYWKVDTAGNQLPYVDRWLFDILGNTEVLLLRTMNGEIDLMHRHINNVENRPVLYGSQDRGDYRLYDAEMDQSNAHSIRFNLNHPDPVVREFANNRDFRVGLSYAIDRAEISDLLHAGMTEPWGISPPQGHPLYHERLASEFIEYNVDLANEYLDRAGYDQIGRDGFRIGPDGQPIVLTMDLVVAQDERINVAELVQAYWRAVGVDVRLNVMERTLYFERRDAGQRETFMWSQDAGLAPLLNSDSWVPEAPAWREWVWPGSYPGVSAQEPPASFKRAAELWDEIYTSSPERHEDLYREIQDIIADEFWLIGTVSPPPGYGIVTNRIGNFLEPIPNSWNYPTPAPVGMEQLFIRN